MQWTGLQYVEADEGLVTYGLNGELFLFYAGCSVKDLRAADYSCEELMAAGCSAKDFVDAGCSTKDLKGAGYNCND